MYYLSLILCPSSCCVPSLPSLSIWLCIFSLTLSHFFCFPFIADTMLHLIWMSFILAFSIFPVFSSISVKVTRLLASMVFIFFFSLPICLFSFFYFCLIGVYLMCLCVHLCVWMCVRGFPNLSCLSAPQLIESHLFDCTFHNDSLRLKKEGTSTQLQSQN